MAKMSMPNVHKVIIRSYLEKMNKASMEEDSLQSSVSFNDFVGLLLNPLIRPVLLEEYAKEFIDSSTVPNPENDTLKETHPAPYQSDQRSY